MKAVKSFTGGIFSPVMRGRDEFSSGAIAIKNMIPMLQGPITRRGGTEYIKPFAGDYPEKTIRIEPFISNEQVVFLVRFYKRTETHTLHIDVVSTDGTVLADFTVGSFVGQYKIWCYQIQDVMWIASSRFKTLQLKRTGVTTFSLSTVDFKNGPYLPQNVTNTTLTLSGTTLTASDDLFSENDVGRWVYLKTVASSTTKCCDVKISSVTDARTAVVSDVNGEYHDGVATKIFRLGAFYANTIFSPQWPEIVVVHQQRLVCVKDRVVYFSKTDSYTDFAISDEAGIVSADNGFRVELAVERGSDVQFAVSMDNLIVGTGSYVYNIRSTSLGEALTPSNATYSRLFDRGCCGIQPVIVENGLVFVDLYRRSVFFSVWSSVTEEYSVDDITRFAQIITEGKIEQVCFCQSPVPVLWCCKKDGGLIGCTFSPKEKVVAWFEANVGGNVVSVCSVPNVSDERDDLYLVVDRNGTECLERLTAGLKAEATTSADAFFVDCGEVRTSVSPVSQITGLTRFVGKKVQILADGAPQPEQTVAAGGTIDLNPAASHVVIGFGFDSYVIPSPIRVAENDETSAKRITKISARLFKSVGMSAGTGENVVFNERSFRSTADRMDRAVPLFTGDYKVQTGGFTNNNAVVWIGQNQPLPLTVLAIYVDVSVNGGGR